MKCSDFLLALHLTYMAPLVTALPKSSSETSRTSEHTKRWEVGPQMNGANFPDPCIIQVDNVWYSFATRTKGSSIHIQIAESQDFLTWNLIYNEDGTQRDALPNLPPWIYAADASTWAPDIVQLDDGTFLMYFSASITLQGSWHCVGAAIAGHILGPYVPYDTALFCPISGGGAIDAAGYNDNGQRYVMYKIDGNAVGHGGICSNTDPPIVPTPILLQAVDRDGVTTHGDPIILLDNKGMADGGSVEAPSLVQSEGTYVLFFSSGCYLTSNYSVNYATAQAITGPYERAHQPLFVTGEYGLVAPGGMSVHPDGHHLVFHANFGSGRALYTADIAISGRQVTSLAQKMSSSAKRLLAATLAIIWLAN